MRGSVEEGGGDMMYWEKKRHSGEEIAIMVGIG